MTARQEDQVGGGDPIELVPTEDAASQAEGLWVLLSMAKPAETTAGAPGLPRAGSDLPQPPTRSEKYGYFHHRRRYVFACLLIAAAGTLYGYVQVATKSSWTSPALALPVVVNLWLRIGRPQLVLSGHHAITRAYQQGCETVDVFLPSCGEPVELFDNSFRCVLGLRWHGTKAVYVHDSAREEVRALDKRYGYAYVVSASRGELRKARNLPYLADPKISIVWTAQFFDVHDRSLSYIQRYSGALQEIFFRFIQPSRDRYKAAICAGANRVHPCRAAEAVGDFTRVPIDEDVHSGVKLWFACCETWYRALLKGSQRATFASLANQQNRWCRSSMLLMVDKYFREAPFTWKQRVAFWAAFLYYMTATAFGSEDPVSRMASRLRTWIVAEQTLLWSSPALRVYQFGRRPYWATLALGAYQLYMLALLITCAAEHDPAGPRRAALTFLAGETALADAGHAWSVAAAGLCVSGPDSFLTQQYRWFARRNPARITEGATR
jgi:hypothetical protein